MTQANETQVGGSHYKHSSYEHWDWAWDAGLDSFQYPITKYVARWKRKGGIEDLEKAEHYLVKYIEVVERDKVIKQSAPEILLIQFMDWSRAEDLDNKQQALCSLVAHWVDTGGLKDALSLLKEYIAEQRGEEPGPGYVDQDVYKQDVTVTVSGVGSEGEGGLEQGCKHPMIHREHGKCGVCGAEV